MMEYKKFKIGFYLILLGILLVILFLSANSSGGGRSEKLTIPQEEEGCESCHGEFSPFEVRASMPDNIGEGEFFEFKITVENTDGDTKHTVTNLDATLTGIGSEPGEPYANEYSGSVSRLAVERYAFPVEAGASHISVTLNGNDGALGRNNIDLQLTSPNNAEWSSNQNGADEEITLEQEDIFDGGLGQYQIQVNYVGGFGPISYTIHVEVIYASTELHQTGDDLDYGDSYDFVWNLALTNQEINNLVGTVSGTVSYEHDGGHLETSRYQVEVSSDMIAVSDSSDIGLNTNLRYGRGLGLFSLVLLGGVFITSASEKGRKAVAQKLKMKNPRRVHCYLAMSILLFAIIHSALLLGSNYTLGSTPSILGSTAFILFIGMTLEGFNREKIVAKIGKRRWKMIHVSLAFGITLIVLYHALVYGGHFFG